MVLPEYLLRDRDRIGSGANSVSRPVLSWRNEGEGLSIWLSSESKSVVSVLRQRLAPQPFLPQSG
jgi:hypothetical protein